MDQYLESLARLREIQATMLYPSHGSPTPHVRAVIDHLIEHRQHREQKTVEALSPRGNSLDELVIKVYDDVESGAHSIAKRSLLAGLIKLEEEGRARRTKAETWARPPDLKTLTSSESGG